MTTRNRRSTRRSSTRRRTGRDVWVNFDVNQVLTLGNIASFDLLVGAAEFMVFDSTIQAVIIEHLDYSYVSVAPAGIRRIAVGFMTGLNTLDSIDFTGPLVDGVGPAWMGMLGASHSVSGLTVQNLTMTPAGPITLKSKRRFRENDATLWMVTQNNHNIAIDTSLALTGLIRILLHIP